MPERVKIFFGMNAANLQAFSGKGGGPDMIGALLDELTDFEVTIIPYEEYEDINQLVSDVDIIIPTIAEIPEKVINSAKKLRGIVQVGVGLDTVDIEAATVGHIPVVNETEGSAVAMGEYAFVLLLCTMKRIIESRELMKEGIFFQPTSLEIAGKTLGLIGLGRSAKEFIKRAKPFDMKIIGIDKYPEKVGDLGIDFIGGIEKLDDILEISDVVSIHCPANKETIGMMNYEKICKMKNTAILINLARANIINREDFIRAIKEKKIAGAGLDVFWNEPMDPNDEILTLSHVFCTPHIATSTVESRLRVFSETGRNIQKVLKGEKPDSCVNPDVVLKSIQLNE